MVPRSGLQGSPSFPRPGLPLNLLPTPPSSPFNECLPPTAVLPGCFKQSQPRTFLSSPLVPSISHPHCSHSSPGWDSPSIRSSRQARNSLPDVSSLENQTIKGVAGETRGICSLRPGFPQPFAPPSMFPVPGLDFSRARPTQVVSLRRLTCVCQQPPPQPLVTLFLSFC